MFNKFTPYCPATQSTQYDSEGKLFAVIAPNAHSRHFVADLGQSSISKLISFISTLLDDPQLSNIPEVDHPVGHRLHSEFPSVSVNLPPGQSKQIDSSV